MQRFFVTFPLSIDLVLTDKDITHQLIRVMRIQIGEEIVLFDGDGSETVYGVEKITKTTISLRGRERRFPKTETEKNISLYQALPNKLEKLEYIIQKWVEVGIRKFVFFRSDFSQKLLLTESKHKRLITIAREAVEQCGGLVMPEIDFIDQIISHQSLATNIVLDTTGKLIKVTEIPKNQDISIWVWPEGWWSEREREKMIENSFLFARFWERVLRTETAGIVACFALLYA
jgi:16S rRNA (uracil1498-N3)-methyltransferase